MGVSVRRSKKRTLLVGLVATFFLSALIIRLFWLQTVDSHHLRVEAQKNWLTNKVLNPQRGTIYDRAKEEPIAWETDAYVFGAELNQINDPKKAAQILSPILQVPQDQVEEKLNTQPTETRVSVELRFPGKYKYDKETFEQIKEIKSEDDVLDGIYAFPTKMRKYTDNSVSHVLGFLNSEGEPVGGIESYYDQLLNGKGGDLVYKKTKDGIMIEDEPQKFNPPEHGKDLVLSIDMRIQKQVEKELEKAMQLYQAKGGTAIIADPKTGEILSLVSRPTYDPNDPASTYDNETNAQNIAVQSQFEPGSTFKIVTLAAAIEEGIFNPDAKFESGAIQVEDQVIRDWNLGGWGEITFREGVELSSNVAFVKLGQRLGQKKLVHYIDQFGFGDVTKGRGQKTGIDLPGEERGYYFRGSLYPTELASISFGQGLSVTPIQQVVAMGAIANGGVLYKPYILKEVWDSEEDKMIRQVKPEGKRIIKKDTADQVRDLLRGVVEKGTGVNADIPGYRVAGKTGTAQKPDPEGKGYLNNKYVVSFIGFAPADNPEIVVYIAIDEPKSPNGDVTGGSVAAPLARDVVQETLKIREIDKNNENKSILK